MPWMATCTLSVVALYWYVRTFSCEQICPAPLTLQLLKMSNPRLPKRKAGTVAEGSDPKKQCLPSSSKAASPQQDSCPAPARPIHARIFRNGQCYIPSIADNQPAGPSKMGLT